MTSPPFPRTLPWISALVLFAGVIAFLSAYFGNTARVEPARFGRGKPVVPVNEKTVPLPKTAKATAAKFMLAAVMRKDLAAAWNLAAPNSYIRPAGFRRKEWMTGSIPVQVIPAEAVQTVAYKVHASHPRAALMEVFVYTKPKSRLDPMGFFIDLEKVGSRWLVTNFTPHASPPVPANGSNS